jgi:hypothetical protein
MLPPTEASLRRDAERHSQLHSWNKHLRHTPTATFIMFLGRGEQPRNEISPEVTDYEGWHIWMHNREWPLLPASTWTTVQLTRDFEGHPGQPAARVEQERQRMIDEIVIKVRQLALDPRDTCRRALLAQEEEEKTALIAWLRGRDAPKPTQSWWCCWK